MFSNKLIPIVLDESIPRLNKQGKRVMHKSINLNGEIELKIHPDNSEYIKESLRKMRAN